MDEIHRRCLVAGKIGKVHMQYNRRLSEGIAEIRRTSELNTGYEQSDTDTFAAEEVAVVVYSGSRSIIVVIEEEARQNEVRARGQVVVGGRTARKERRVNEERRSIEKNSSLSLTSCVCRIPVEYKWTHYTTRTTPPTHDPPPAKSTQLFSSNTLNQLTRHLSSPRIFLILSPHRLVGLWH